MTTITSAMTVIGPNEAAAMMKQNGHNRPLREATWKHYSREMQDGLWMQTGEPIQISNDGDLLNGQHRLQAVIASGLKQTFLVVRGLPLDAMKNIDTGRIRGVGDILTMHGFVSGALLAATAQWGMRFLATRQRVDDNEWTWNPYGGNKTKEGTFQHFRPTATETMQFIDSNAKIKNSVTVASGHYHDCGSRFFPPSMAAFIHYYGSKHNNAMADSFVMQLYRGEEVPHGSPMALLRRRLNQSRMGKARLPPKEQLALAIVAWNMTARGEKIIKMLRWSSTESYPGPICS